MYVSSQSIETTIQKRMCTLRMLVSSIKIPRWNTEHVLSNALDYSLLRGVPRSTSIKAEKNSKSNSRGITPGDARNTELPFPSFGGRSTLAT